MVLSQDQIEKVNQGMDALHGFFAKPLVVYKEAEKTVISEDQNHSFLFNSPQNTEVTKEIVTGVINARIYYGKIIEDPVTVGGLNNKDIDISATLPQGWIRIVTDITGKAILEGSKKIVFENETYDLHGIASRHGLLTKNFYSFNLQPSV